jgi:hypothetical protein
MLSSFERERDFRKSLFASAQASAATRFPALNAERLIPRLAYSRNWPRLSELLSRIFSFANSVTTIQMTTSWPGALLQAARETSGRERSLRPSTRPLDTTLPDTPEPGGRQDFNPTLVEIIVALERSPKQFPKKSGSLSHIRAASTKYRGAAWRVRQTSIAIGALHPRRHGIRIVLVARPIVFREVPTIKECRIHACR